MVHMKRILIASDDMHTRALIGGRVADLDVSSAECSVADIALRLGSGRFDLLVLDVDRDPVNALEVVDRVVAAGSDASVLVVVDQETLPELRVPVRAPSDFIVRTASAEEFAVRVRTLLWPGEEATERDIVRIEGRLTVNLSTYQAHLDGEPVDFTFLEYSLFVFLLTHPGRTYSRETLMQRVWGSDYFGGSRTVDVHVRRIRAKLGPELSRHLETVRHVGYLWRA